MSKFLKTFLDNFNIFSKIRKRNFRSNLELFDIVEDIGFESIGKSISFEIAPFIAMIHCAKDKYLRVRFLKYFTNKGRVGKNFFKVIFLSMHNESPTNN